MELKELLNKSGLNCPEGATGIVTGLSYDSRKVEKGHLFFALKGVHADGHDFLKEVRSRGALAAIVERKLPLDLPQIETGSMAETMAKVSDIFFGHPAGRIPVIGITGTNGKTTTTYLIEDLFRAQGKVSGIMGTINYRLGKSIEAAPNTTPLSIDVQNFISQALAKGASCVVMEVSSHALMLHRVDFVKFRVGVFTNLTQDHLDFHKDMESYYQAKAKLFQDPETKCVINLDDPYGERLLKSRPDGLSYGFSSRAKLRAENRELSLDGIRFELIFPSGRKAQVSTNLMGEHNIFNCLSAAGALIAFGVSEGDIVKGLNLPHNVPGRLERIETGQDFVVVVDFAHTHDALEKVIKALRQTNPKRILTLFGAGGDRDRTKRPKMGRVATDLSDFVYVTSDNPRSENPLNIINDIKSGISTNNYLAIPEREEAIRRIISDARKGDILLLAGKGHEEYQIIGNTKYPFSDQAMAKKFLGK